MAAAVDRERVYQEEVRPQKLSLQYLVGQAFSRYDALFHLSQNSKALPFVAPYRHDLS